MPDQQFQIRTEDGEVQMSTGHKSNVRNWFEQNNWHGEVRRFDERGVTVIVVADVREEWHP